MANYHANHLAIAAGEQDMISVLKVLGFNLATNSEAPFDTVLRGCTSVWGAWCRVNEAIRDCSMYAFAPSCSSANAWLKAHAEDMRAMIAEDPTYAHISQKLGITETEGELAFTAEGEPYSIVESERPTVDMFRFGMTYVLQIAYGTKWAPNSDDVDTLLSLLPPGTYGVAFLDADESEHYRDLSCTAGTHPGATTMFGLDELPVNLYGPRAFRAFAKKHFNESLALEADLGRVALIVAACKWEHYYGCAYLSNKDLGWPDFRGDASDGMIPKASAEGLSSYGDKMWSWGVDGAHPHRVCP